MAGPLDDSPFPRAARHFRVDPRFVHATVVNTWVPTLGARVLVVVDRRTAESPRRRAILELSAMNAAEVRFANELAVTGLLDTVSPEFTTLTLFANLESVERAVSVGLAMDRLVVGHVPVGPGRAAIHPAVHLGEAERAAIDRLEQLGVRVEIRPLPSDKVLRVSRPPPRPATLPPRVRARLEETLRVVNAKGLHLRAANQIAQLASRMPCEVSIAFDDQTVNAKSLLGLTTLGAGYGSKVMVIVDGLGAHEALAELRALFVGGFGEGVAEGRGGSP